VFAAFVFTSDPDQFGPPFVAARAGGSVFGEFCTKRSVVVSRLGMEKKMRCWLGLASLAGMAVFHGVTFAQSPSLVTDGNRTEVATLGKPGLAIALTRNKVSEILESENSCSAWFRSIDPNAAATFASLKFVIDAKGPQYVVGWRNDAGVLFFKHPYSARTLEGTGANSVVTLNANGPFFVRTGVVMWQEHGGTFRHAIGSCILQVGSYPGNTLAAQITTLLHEFGHIVKRIPEDSDEMSGQSGRNTEEVIHHCHAQIKAAARHAGPASP
jgi:hypothetical protein